MNKLPNDITRCTNTTKSKLFVYIVLSFSIHVVILIISSFFPKITITKEDSKVTWVDLPLVDDVGGSGSNTNVIGKQEGERQPRVSISNNVLSHKQPEAKKKVSSNHTVVNGTTHNSNSVETKGTKTKSQPSVGTAGTSANSGGIGTGSALYGLSPSVGTSGIVGSISGLDKDFPFLWYIQQIQLRITSNWNRINLAQGRVQIYFRIKRNGDIVGARIESPSGNNSLDQTALMAVRRSDPLPKLPDTFSADDLGVRFWFTYINS